MADSSLPYAETLNAILSVLPEKLQKPRVGFVCGSGLGGLVDSFREVQIISYDTIPGFAKSTVPGHKSALAFGILGTGTGVPVVAMLGRFHFYEGHSFPKVVYPIRIMARLGIKEIIITNAAGALNPDIPIGTIVIIQDHLALPTLTGMNPLIGPQTSPNHPRFLPLSDAYSTSLRRLAFIASHQLSLDKDALAEGVYAWVSGPTYETAVEGRFLRNGGADVVGMSTVPEVLAAREEGLEVMAMSLVTNFVVIPEEPRRIKEEVEAELAGRPMAPPVVQVVSHEDVLEIGRIKADVVKRLVERVVDLISS